MTTPVLETRGLSKSFGALRVAREIELTLEKGARRALIGPNGAGKTRLVKLITGALRPPAGQGLLEGEDSTHLSPPPPPPRPTEAGARGARGPPRLPPRRPRPARGCGRVCAARPARSARAGA